MVNMGLRVALVQRLNERTPSRLKQEQGELLQGQGRRRGRASRWPCLTWSIVRVFTGEGKGVQPGGQQTKQGRTGQVQDPCQSLKCNMDYISSILNCNSRLCTYYNCNSGVTGELTRMQVNIAGLVQELKFRIFPHLPHP